MTAVSAPAEPTPAQIAAGRRTLLLATGALMLPFVLGAGLYFSGWRPSQTGNRGELLHPPVPFPAAQFMGEGGQPLAPADLAGKWTLVLAGRGACEAACTGRIKALERLADVPAAERPAHATRLLCAALATPAHGTASLARDAEMEMYADVLRGHVTLT